MEIRVFIKLTFPLLIWFNYWVGGGYLSVEIYDFSDCFRDKRHKR